MSVLSNLNSQAQSEAFTSKELKVLWANEYMQAASASDTDHRANMAEVRAQQKLSVDDKTIKAKNLSTVAGVGIAAAILLKEYGGVVASKALPMVSKFL